MALLAVPLMTEWLTSRRRNSVHSLEHALILRMQAVYGRLAERSINSPRRVLLTVLALVALGGVAFWRLPSGFMPHMDEGGFILDYRAGPGTSLAETDRL